MAPFTSHSHYRNILLIAFLFLVSTCNVAARASSSSDLAARLLKLDGGVDVLGDSSRAARVHGRGNTVLRQRRDDSLGEALLPGHPHDYGALLAVDDGVAWAHHRGR
ncbi:unnamed protein product [Linum trigynum]|uniref:Uncharacterized protein n=1 Tax=Linum trigynum TaxID=586398 RepID=A0AAV2GPW3_9ROSI